MIGLNNVVITNGTAIYCGVGYLAQAKIYIPKNRVVVASSFEGVVNNGAKECCLVSLNARERMRHNKALDGASFGKILSPGEFQSIPVQGSYVVKAFLALRPLVAVAEDYLKVLELIERYPNEANGLASGVDKERNICFFTNEFQSLESEPKHKAFKEEFYRERKAMQEANYREWLSLQEPYAETIAQLREISMHKKANRSGVYKGFVLSYVTSKDEKTTFELCNAWVELGHLLSREVDSFSEPDPLKDWAGFLSRLNNCLIARERIIGLESVPNADKVEQMKIIAAREEVPPNQIIRINDRYDERETNSLILNGFTHNVIVTGGYAFPGDYAKAIREGIPVLKRSNLAQELLNYAKKHNF